MIRGAFIFAMGAAAGLAIGTVNGLILGFRVSESIKKASEFKIDYVSPEGAEPTMPTVVPSA